MENALRDAVVREICKRAPEDLWGFFGSGDGVGGGFEGEDQVVMQVERFVFLLTSRDGVNVQAGKAEAAGDLDRGLLARFAGGGVG